MNARYLRQKSLLRFIIVCFVLCLFTGRLWALDARYKRNGECYLFVTEKSNYRYGIYRLNNAEKDIVYDDATDYKVVTPDADSSLAFAVDLDKNIYTFSEKIAGNYEFLSDLKLKRQVLDSVDPDQADYGEHTWIHYDHRYDLLRYTGFSVQPNVYRVGPRNRRIRDNWGGWWGNFRSAGPGKYIGRPSKPKLPYFSNSALQDYEHWGRNWYEIPNGAWYSSWKEGYAYCNGMTKFYYVFGDFIKGKAHNWQKYTHTPDNIYRDKPWYTQHIGEVVATNYEQQISRYALAGCLDGCGGANGNESAAAEQVYTDLAFVPLKGGGSRTYFYSRTMGDTDGVIKLNNRKYRPFYGNPIIGDPERTDTQWIGVSARDKNSDYVYALGTSVIKEWYEACTNRSANLDIQAVAVSNQWNQKGAVVYAYDMNKGMVLKFIRDEKNGDKPATYEFIDVDDLFAREHMHIGVKSEDKQIDDLKADGFGNLYFGFSYPTRNWGSYWGYYYYEIGDAKDISYPISYESRWIWGEGWKDIGRGYLVFILDYNKAVYRLKASDRSVQRMGGMNFSREYYSMPVGMYREDWNALRSMLISSPLPNSRLDSFIKERTKKSGCYFGKNYDRVVDKPYDFNTGVPSDGSLGYKPFIDYVIYGIDRSNGRLSVINVPTPPEVTALEGNKSYLDIIGPYEEFPTPEIVHGRHTNQDKGLLNASKALNINKLYFYMVENYPVPMPSQANANHEYELSGSQDPRSQKDWNENTRLGGFVSSVDKLKFTWQTFMIEDYRGNHTDERGNILCEEIGEPNHDYVHYIYSPTAGKYIITCRVEGSYYDYDSLEFGTTADDCGSCRRTFDARPSGVGSAIGAMREERPEDRLRAIGKIASFGFLLNDQNALISTYKNKIIKGQKYLAMIPVVVTGETNEAPELIDEAVLERCDEVAINDDGRANYNIGESGSIDNGGHWASLNQSSKEHGIMSGKPYYWRIALASQTNILEDISKKTGSYVAKKLTDNKGQRWVNVDGEWKEVEINPFYVNRNSPGFEFVDEPNALVWDDNIIAVEAALTYKVPSETKPHTENLTNAKVELIKRPRRFTENIMIAETPSMVPTDPYVATLTVTMSRMFKYRMHVRVKTRDGTWQEAFAMMIPGRMRIKGVTTVRVVDTQPPQIVYHETKPKLGVLYGYTGCKLADYSGNPSNVEFSIEDNNPWEAASSVDVGVSAAVAQANRIDNACMMAQIENSSLPTANINLKPVFAKDSHKVFMCNDTTYNASDSAGFCYVEHRELASTTAMLNEKAQEAAAYNKDLRNTGNSTFERESNGTMIYRAVSKFSFPTTSIKLGAATDTFTVPIGYANNTPGYEPYKFYVTAVDSSGNLIPYDKQELNLVAEVADSVPPIPFVTVSYIKGDAVNKSCVPMYAVKKNNKYEGNWQDSRAKLHIAGLPETEFGLGNEKYNQLPTVIEWKANNNGVIAGIASNTVNNYTYGDATHCYLALKSKGNNIVKSLKRGTDEAYTRQVANSIPLSPAEDNLEVAFNIEVVDNAGSADAHLKFKYLDIKGQLVDVERNASYKSIATDVANISQPAVKGIKERLELERVNGAVACVFGGTKNDFPYVIPITITATDDAKEFNTRKCKCTQEQPYSFEWVDIKEGALCSNKRTLKTSMPVYGSYLNIRTIEKSTIND